MSGEFGDDNGGGFFHDKLRAAAENAEGSSLATTKAWAKVLKPIAEVARDISYAEANDSSEESALRSTYERLPDIRSAMWTLERMTDGIADAVRDGMDLAFRPVEMRWEGDGVVVAQVGETPKFLTSWQSEAFRKMLLKRAIGWAKAQGDKRWFWLRISSYGSDGTYRFTSKDEDVAARSAIERIRGLLATGCGIEEIRKIVSAVEIRENWQA